MFLTYLGRELRRRRKAALVVASGLALGIALVIVVSSVSSGMEQAQSKVLRSLYGLGTDITVSKAAEPRGEGGGGRRPSFEFDAGDDEGDSGQSQDIVMVQGFQTLDAGTVAQVGEQDGVADAVGGLGLTVMKVDGEFRRGEVAPAEPGTGEGAGRGGGTGGEESGGRVRGGGAAFDVDSFTVYGTDVSSTELGPLTSSAITDGRALTDEDAGADTAVLDSAYAQEEELEVGSDVTVSGTDFEVVGIATPDSGDAAADVYVPLGRAQALADVEEEVTTVYVKATDSQRIDAVKAGIEEEVPDATVTTSADLADTVSGSLTTASDLASNVGKWLSSLVLAAAFLVAGLLTSAAVSRRVREFGTLKALGWRSSRVTRQVVGEALVNGLIGGALGIALGLAGAWAVTAFSPTLTAELGASAGAAGGGPGGGPGGGAGGGPGGGGDTTVLDIALSAPVSPTTIGMAVTLAVAGGLVAGGFGGWRASRLRPADALRRVE